MAWLTAPVSKLSVRLSLIGDDAVGLVQQVRIAARDRPGGRIVGIGCQQVGGAAHERGQQVVLTGAAPAQGVLQRCVAGKVMLHDQRRHVGLDVVVVGIGAVEVRRVHGRSIVEERSRRIGRAVAGQADGGYAAVGHVVLGDVQQVQIHAGGRAQSERQRRSNAPAVVLDVVAAGHATVLTHHVQTECAVLAEHLVPVGGGAFLVVAAVAQ